MANILYTQTETSYFDTPHTVDVYEVQASGLKAYRRLNRYQQNETLYASLTRSAGQIDGIYLLHGTSLDYDITAHSGNLTTTNGQLLVFTSNTNSYYNLYIEGSESHVSRIDSILNFTIGADNRPMKIKFSMRANVTSYYFFTCKVPENSTFSFNASSDEVFYNYSDYGDKLVTLTKPYTGQRFYLSAMNETIIILGYVHPNATGYYNLYFS